MPADRLAVLNSAMSFVTHLSQTTAHGSTSGVRTSRVVNILEGIGTPSVDLLYWMLRGAFVFTSSFDANMMIRI